MEGANPRVKFEVSLAVLADSTVAVEVAVSNALVNWPYFQDLSLVRPPAALASLAIEDWSTAEVLAVCQFF